MLELSRAKISTVGYIATLPSGRVQGLNNFILSAHSNSAVPVLLTLLSHCSSLKAHPKTRFVAASVLLIVRLRRRSSDSCKRCEMVLLQVSIAGSLLVFEIQATRSTDIFTIHSNREGSTILIAMRQGTPARFFVLEAHGEELSLMDLISPAVDIKRMLSEIAAFCCKH